MGSKNNRKKKKNTNINLQKIKIDESKEINKVKSLNLSQNKDLLNFPPPIFKNFKKFISDDEYDLIGEFWIYKLKDINDAFYISFLMDYKGIVIYKYHYEKKILEKINTIKINVCCLKEEIMIRYIYNDLDKKEYLFVEKGPDNLFIYLIKDEKNYELINKDECNDYKVELDLNWDGGRDSTFFADIEKINLFEVIYNQFDKNIYIITIYDIGYQKEVFSHYEKKEFNIKIFKENKIISSSKLQYSDSLNEYYPYVKDLIYKDNNSNKYFILYFIENNYRMIEIKEYNSDQTIDIECHLDIKYIVNSEKDIKSLKEFFDKKCYDFYAKIFYGYNDTSLYISSSYNNTSEIIIIDLIKRTIVKQFIINIETINYFENWGLKYMIILCYDSIYIFDKYTNQIITKYSNIFGGSINEVLTHFSKKNNFYGLFINSDIEFKYFI